MFVKGNVKSAAEGNILACPTVKFAVDFLLILFFYSGSAVGVVIFSDGNRI